MTAGSGLILVTGAGGYLGGRLVAHLRQGGRPLRLVSRPGGGGGAGQGAGLAGEAALRGDLRDPSFARAALEGVTTVVHLAAPNEIESQADPLGAIDVTIGGTLVLLQAARAAGVARFVYLSTAHVYGPLEGTIHEGTVPRPTHPYAITHRAAEDFVLAATAGGPRGVVLRLSNAVGAPARAEVNRWTLLANDLCRQAITTSKLVLRSAGLQWRDFVAMSDVCGAITHLVDLPADRLEDGLFNVGSGEALRVIDLAERIRDRTLALTGTAPTIVRPAPAPGETHPPLNFSVDKLWNTNFKFGGSLDDEIDATLLLCRQSPPT
jgi:UDP-glucose 4-epimerase